MNTNLSFKTFRNTIKDIINNKTKNINSDIIGALSAFVCIIHCAIVPILMAFHSFHYVGDALASHDYHAGHSHSSIFEHSHWHSLDYFFIVITLVAVYFATRKSVVSWISVSLWSAASLFVISILLKETVAETEYIAYLASGLLIIFHFLNQRLGKRMKTNAIKMNEEIEMELNFGRSSFENITLKIDLETEIQSKKQNRVSCAC